MRSSSVFYRAHIDGPSGVFAQWLGLCRFRTSCYGYGIEFDQHDKCNDVLFFVFRRKRGRRAARFEGKSRLHILFSKSPQGLILGLILTRGSVTVRKLLQSPETRV